MILLWSSRRAFRNSTRFRLLRELASGRPVPKRRRAPAPPASHSKTSRAPVRHFAFGCACVLECGAKGMGASAAFGTRPATTQRVRLELQPRSSRSEVRSRLLEAPFSMGRLAARGQFGAIELTGSPAGRCLMVIFIRAYTSVLLICIKPDKAG